MDLDDALVQFDATEENLRRLDAIWAEMREIIPEGIAFMDGGAEGRRYTELMRAYAEITQVVPSVRGYRLTARPLELNAIGQMRLDAAEISEISAELAAEETIFEPDTALAEYRAHFERARDQTAAYSRYSGRHIARSTASAICSSRSCRP